LQEGAIPGRDLDTASQAALVQAQAAYDAAKQHLDTVRSVSREAALKSAQGQLTSAEGKYKGAEAQVSFPRFAAPSTAWSPTGRCSPAKRPSWSAADHRDGHDRR
jgi:HlyD family secretion protein